MEEFGPLLIGVAVLVGCLTVVWLTVLVLKRAGADWPNWLKAFLAGILPTMLIIAGLTVWHFQVLEDVRAGRQEGFMSPLVILIYGFPIFFVNLAANFLAAVSMLKRQ
jgi:hypothetical protein